MALKFGLYIGCRNTKMGHSLYFVDRVTLWHSSQPGAGTLLSYHQWIMRPSVKKDRKEGFSFSQH